MRVIGYETRKGDLVMQTATYEMDTKQYARSVKNSKRIRWDIDKDVIRGRDFDYARRFLPNTLSKVDELEFLTEDEKRLLTQIQGRTYANTFRLVERFINAKILDVSRDHWLGDQVALEALVRFSDEEIKHQELFRRIDKQLEQGLPTGYRYLPQENEVASVVLGKSTWAVLALTCHIEVFVQAHYKESIDREQAIDELFKDVFKYHWLEEAQHVVLDELEWAREDAKLTAEERDQAVNDLIELVAAVDGILQIQSVADVEYFTRIAGRSFSDEEVEALKAGVLRAYRWQYIVSGVQQPRFSGFLSGLISQVQAKRISTALAPIM
jgi:hypothetical protein